MFSTMLHAVHQAAANRMARQPMPQGPRLNRVSVGLSDKEYRELKALAEKHHISLAWLGRQAIAEFLDRHADQPLQLPLIVPRKHETEMSNG